MAGQFALLAAAMMGGKGIEAAGGYLQGRMTSLGYKRKGWQAAQAAEEVERQAGYESWRRDLMQRRQTGSQVAGYAGAGVDLAGSAIENLAASVKMMTLDKLMVQRAARVEAIQDRDEAKFYGMAAKAARQAGSLSAIGSFLGGASSVMSNWPGKGS